MFLGKSLIVFLGGTRSDLMKGDGPKSSLSPCIGVAMIFEWGEGQTKNDMQWCHQKFLKEELFVGQRYRRLYDQKL